MYRPRRILHIDDDRDIVQAIAIRLRAVGYDVLAAYDGREGLNCAIQSRPDAIILDIRMPGMDGLTTLAKLREQEDTKHIPVVMLSASLVDQRRAIEAGAKYFLEKPCDAKRLVAAVDSAITETDIKRSTKMTRRTVLIADDDPALVHRLGQRCQELGLLARTSCTGMEAVYELTTVHDEPPDLIILDLDVPLENNRSVYDILLNGRIVAPIPVIVLVRTDQQTIHRCEELGVHYVSKSPDMWHHLEASIIKLLDLQLIGSSHASAPPQAEAEPVHCSSPKVLCIDDDREFCKALQIKLQAHGMNALQSFTGVHGFWKALRERPGAVITDFGMPGNGNFVLRSLKGQTITKHIPVIILTGRSDPRLKREVLRLGAADFFTKPPDYDLLLAQLKKLLRLPAGRDSAAAYPAWARSPGSTPRSIGSETTVRDAPCVEGEYSPALPL